MSNTSATGGYLLPLVTPAPRQGQSLEDFLGQIISGISGLSGDVLFPRWQEEPPNLPAVGTDWAAFGIISRFADAFPNVNHLPDTPDANGTDQLIRQETLNILASFYGPNADDFATVLRDGFVIDQNLAVLRNNAMAFVETGDMLAVPSLVKNLWLYRTDLPIVIRRAVQRYYPVLNLESAQATITAVGPDDKIVSSIVVTQ